MYAYCDGKTDGGGWLLIERRKSGEDRFYQRSASLDWLNFGDISGDFWMGLDIIHMLTAKKPMELMVEIKYCDGKLGRFKYDKFEVGPAESQFQLHLDPGKDDSLGEGLGSSNGQHFGSDTVVASQHLSAGWWWNEMPTVSLHQQLGCDMPPPLNSFWFTRVPQRRRPIKWFEMKLRPRLPSG